MYRYTLKFTLPYKNSHERNNNRFKNSCLFVLTLVFLKRAPSSAVFFSILGVMCVQQQRVNINVFVEVQLIQRCECVDIIFRSFQFVKCNFSREEEILFQQHIIAYDLKYQFVACYKLLIVSVSVLLLLCINLSNIEFQHKT